jgi:hypothetical protein
MQLWRSENGGPAEAVGAPASYDPQSAGFPWTVTMDVPGTTSFHVTWDGDEVHLPATSEPFAVNVARQQSELSMERPSRSEVTYGQTTRMTAHLVGGESSPRVDLVHKVGGVEHVVATSPTDAAGDVTFEVKPSATGTYFASFAGDDLWEPARSTGWTVRVRSVTTGRMLRSHSTSGKYAVYGRSQRVYYRTKVAPDQGGHKVDLILQGRVDGSWYEALYTTAKLENDSTVTVYIAPSSFPPGVDRWRWKSAYQGSRTLLRSASGWVYFLRSGVGRMSGTAFARTIPYRTS